MTRRKAKDAAEPEAFTGTSETGFVPIEQPEPVEPEPFDNPPGAPLLETPATDPDEGTDGDGDEDVLDNQLPESEAT